MALAGTRLGSPWAPSEARNSVIACIRPSSSRPAAMIRLTDGWRSLNSVVNSCAAASLAVWFSASAASLALASRFAADGRGEVVAMGGSLV